MEIKTITTRLNIYECVNNNDKLSKNNYMTNVLKYNEVCKELIQYDNPEKMGTSYICPIGYDETLKPLYIQTPKLKFKINYDNPTYIDIEIPINKMDFYEFFITMDELNINKTFSNSNEWFNKELPFEAIDDMYKRTIKPIKKDINPNIRIKIPNENGKIQCSLYNQDRIYMGLDELRNVKNEDTEIILILHLRGLKIYKTSFIFDVYVSQMKVFLNNQIKYNIISDYSIIDDEGDNNNDIFTEEILSVNEEKMKKENKKKEKEKKEKEKQEKINKIQEEILKKEKEMKDLLN